MINSGAAIMAQRYSLPSMCGGLSSDAKELDAQAGFEKVATAIPLLEHNASIIYGVGATDAGSTISYTQMVFDDEIIAGLRRLEEGISLHDLEEEVDLIKSLTPRGNFMSAKHTLRHYKEHWYPKIISRDNYQGWKDKGQNIASICSQKAREIIANHRPPPLSPATEAELQQIVRDFIPGFSFDNLARG
jgi:trimethylamine--corrinoid protein Co-methyltransferase